MHRSSSNLSLKCLLFSSAVVALLLIKTLSGMPQLNGMREQASEEAISKFVASCDVNQTTFSSDLWNAIYFESYFFVVAS